MIAFIGRTHTELCIKLSLSHTTLSKTLFATLSTSLYAGAHSSASTYLALSLPGEYISRARATKKTAAESRSSLLHIILFSLMMPPLFFFTRSDTS